MGGTMTVRRYGAGASATGKPTVVEVPTTAAAAEIAAAPAAPTMADVMAMMKKQAETIADLTARLADAQKPGKSAKAAVPFNVSTGKAVFNTTVDGIAWSVDGGKLNIVIDLTKYPEHVSGRGNRAWTLKLRDQPHGVGFDGTFWATADGMPTNVKRVRAEG